MVFVRYHAGLERPEENFDANQQIIIDRIKTYESESVAAEGANVAVRFAHAKAYGLLRADFEILPDVPPEYAQGIYGRPGRHAAVVRYSNGLAHLGADDTLGPVVGMAVKLFNVDGPMELDDERHSRTMDFNMINGPIFFCNTVQKYVFLEKIFVDLPKYHARGKDGRNQMFHDWVTGFGNLAPADWAWDELGAFLRLGGGAVWQNLLLSSFWSMGAVRHGDYIAKLRIRPTAETAAAIRRRQLDPGTAKEVFRPALVAEMAERACEFDFQVQLCTDPATMPFEDLTVEWPEAASPFVTVARLRLPRQDIGDEANLRAAEGISLTPWRCPKLHHPVGSLQRLRKEVYRQSSIHRHNVNGVTRQEPRTPDDLFR